MTAPIHTVEADVLILGGGSAGSMAAIWAKQMDPSQKVVVFEKGDIKYSGCIARGMDALNVVALPGVSTAGDYIRSMRTTCDEVIDDPPSYAMVSRSYELVKTLTEWGVYFPKDEQGNYEMLQTHPHGKFQLSMLEPDLKVKLARQMALRGCQVLNRVMAVELLLDDGRVVGAIGMNVRTGELLVCRAKAVILSAGGTARFGLPNSGYLYGVFDFPGNTGDGYMLAYRAGAGLTGFEYTERYCIVKDVNIPLIYIVGTRGAKFIDAFDQDVADGGPVMKALLRRHEEGRGPTRFRLDHLDERKIQEVEEILFTVERPIQERFYQGRKVEFRRDAVELWPTDYFLCGGHGMAGVVVNDRAETGVPGLYAAGDTSCVAIAFLSGAFAFGQIAAENGTAFGKSSEPGRVDQAQVEAFQRKLSRIGEAKGRVGVDEFEYKARRLITDYVTPPKNALKLTTALEWMNRLSQQLYEEVRPRSTRDVFKVLEIENILGCAAISAAASLERKESRWKPYHYRTDYPERDDANWLKHVVSRRGGADTDVIVSHKPVERMEVDA